MLILFCTLVSANFIEHFNKLPSNSIHIIITGDGTCYHSWMAKIAYYSFKKLNSSNMLGFTHVVHGVDHMHDYYKSDTSCEVPSFHTTKSEIFTDSKHPHYPPMQRPEALVKWVNYVKNNPHVLKGRWIALTDADVLFLGPIFAPNAFDPNQLGYYFEHGYMVPQNMKPDQKQFLKKLYPSIEVEKLPGGFPSYSVVRFDDFERIVNIWAYTAEVMHEDLDSPKILSWEREMYAGQVALYLSGVRLVPCTNYITQIFHRPFNALESVIYDYSHPIYIMQGNNTLWEFNKRYFYQEKYCNEVPVLPPLPNNQYELVVKSHDGYYPYGFDQANILYQTFSEYHQNYKPPSQCFPHEHE